MLTNTYYIPIYGLHTEAALFAEKPRDACASFLLTVPIIVYTTHKNVRVSLGVYR